MKKTVQVNAVAAYKAPSVHLVASGARKVFCMSANNESYNESSDWDNIDDWE